MKRYCLIFIAVIMGSLGFAADGHHHNEPQNNTTDEEFNTNEVIMHHIADAHDWHLFDKVDKETGEKHAVSVPLPVILYYHGHLDVFMSSKFEHGHATVKKDDREYKLYEGKIYIAKQGALNFNKEHAVINEKPLDFSITKNVASMIFTALILVLIFIPMARKYKRGNGVPKGLQSLFEPIVLFVVDDIAKPNIGEKKYKKYLPYLLTVFFFIWINNLLGIIPILPGGANVMGNIAVTLSLAAFSMILINFSGNKNYWGHIFKPAIPLWLYPIMVPVEIIGVLSKPFALMVRLFANIMAGHIIALSLVSLIFIFKTVWMSPVSIAFVLFMDVLELLVAILQAYIFTLLTAIFIGMAVQEHH